MQNTGAVMICGISGRFDSGENSDNLSVCKNSDNLSVCENSDNFSVCENSDNFSVKKMVILC